MRAPAKTAQWLGRVSAITLILGGVLQAQTTSIIYSTYLGGSGSDTGLAVAAGPDGGTYVAGVTLSLDFPTFRAGQPDPNQEPDRFLDAFVTRFGPTGQLIYSTYLGVPGASTPRAEIPLAIAAGPDGTAYVTGFIDIFFEGNFAFLARVRPFEVSFLPLSAGSRSAGRDVTVDSLGNVYVTGGGSYPHPRFGEIPQAFVVKLGSDGSSLYFTPLEGLSADERGNAIAVDTAGNAYAAGVTTSPDFPTTSGAFQGSYQGRQDGFITKLDPSGAILFSTFLGGSGSDGVSDLAVDAPGNLFAAGRTTSADFPLLDPAQATLRGPSDLFLARFDPAGTLVASTYLGGSGSEEVTSLSLDGSGRLYLAGWTTSTDSPLSLAGCHGRFLAELDPGSFEILQATCLPEADMRDVAVDQEGNLHLAGASLGGLPVVNAFQPQPAGGVDAFATKLSLNQPPVCTAAFASPATIWPANGKLVPVSILGVTDPDGDPITIAVTAVHQDEPLSRTGLPDATGVGTAVAQLRADRSGKGDGRVYHLRFEAGDSAGATCVGTVSLCVPHDRRPGAACGDGGALFNSAGFGG